MLTTGAPRIACTRMIEAGACSNRRRYYLDDIERRVIGGLHERLGSPEAIEPPTDRFEFFLHWAA